jgi:hypothetical protein
MARFKILGEHHQARWKQNDIKSRIIIKMDELQERILSGELIADEVDMIEVKGKGKEKEVITPTPELGVIAAWNGNGDNDDIDDDDYDHIYAHAGPPTPVAETTDRDTIMTDSTVTSTKHNSSKSSPVFNTNSTIENSLHTPPASPRISMFPLSTPLTFDTISTELTTPQTPPTTPTLTNVITAPLQQPITVSNTIIQAIPHYNLQHLSPESYYPPVISKRSHCSWRRILIPGDPDAPGINIILTDPYENMWALIPPPREWNADDYESYKDLGILMEDGKYRSGVALGGRSRMVRGKPTKKLVRECVREFTREFRRR